MARNCPAWSLLIAWRKGTRAEISYNSGKEAMCFVKPCCLPGKVLAWQCLVHSLRFQTRETIRRFEKTTACSLLQAFERLESF